MVLDPWNILSHISEVNPNETLLASHRTVLVGYTLSRYLIGPIRDRTDQQCRITSRPQLPPAEGHSQGGGPEHGTRSQGP